MSLLSVNLLIRIFDGLGKFGGMDHLVVFRFQVSVEMSFISTACQVLRMTVDHLVKLDPAQEVHELFNLQLRPQNYTWQHNFNLAAIIS